MIQITNLLHRYNERPVLDIPELTLEKGFIHIFNGANGSGKTTLMRLINQLGKPTQGSIEVQVSRRKMVFCAQKPYLFRMTVRQNIEYGLKARGHNNPSLVSQMMEQLGIDHLGACPARKLSAGETHRTNLARAAVLQPQLLLLDEPFAHLDTNNSDRTKELLQNLHAQGTTIVIATHLIGRIDDLTSNMIQIHQGKIRSNHV